MKDVATRAPMRPELRSQRAVGSGASRMPAVAQAWEDALVLGAAFQDAHDVVGVRIELDLQGLDLAGKRVDAVPGVAALLLVRLLSLHVR